MASGTNDSGTGPGILVEARKPYPCSNSLKPEARLALQNWQESGQAAGLLLLLMTSSRQAYVCH